MFWGDDHRQYICVRIIYWDLWLRKRRESVVPSNLPPSMWRLIHCASSFLLSFSWREYAFPVQTTVGNIRILPNIHSYKQFRCLIRNSAKSLIKRGDFKKRFFSEGSLSFKRSIFRDAISSSWQILIEGISLSWSIISLKVSKSLSFVLRVGLYFMMLSNILGVDNNSVGLCGRTTYWWSAFLVELPQKGITGNMARPPNRSLPKLLMWSNGGLLICATSTFGKLSLAVLFKVVI